MIALLVIFPVLAIITVAAVALSAKTDWNSFDHDYACCDERREQLRRRDLVLQASEPQEAFIIAA